VAEPRVGRAVAIEVGLRNEDLARKVSGRASA